MARATFISYFVVFLVGSAFAQQELHIHHINIENGDATMVGIYDRGLKTYTSKVLIDGGQSSADEMLLPYIKKMVGDSEKSSHFEYVILTHYHNDHYNGLLSIQTGKITADSIIDPGGYKVDSFFIQNANSGSAPASLKKATLWLEALKKAAHHQPKPFVKARSRLLIRYGTNSSTTIGTKIILGKVGSNNVELMCLAGWGNTLSENGEIQANPRPLKTNANNFTLAFLVSCGEFRYFIGGDMGGQNTGDYIDQETTVTKFLNNEYPLAHSIAGSIEAKGHVCGFKSNHHGSNHSNTSDFMEAMRPTITITSAGNNKKWHLPHPEYLNRLAVVNPISQSGVTADSVSRKGVYFTNLYNFTQFPSRTNASALFKDKDGISFDFGNNAPTSKGSYLIKITNQDLIGQKSIFEVGRVDIDGAVPYKRLSTFLCHSK